MEHIYDNSNARADIERLYVENRERIFCVVRSAINNDNIADDIVQEVFVEALKRYEEFRNHPNQLGWLYQTAKYKVCAFNKKLRYRKFVDIEVEDIMIEDVENGYSDTEINQALSGILTSEELKRYYRYFVWGNTVEELARLEGVSVNNMRVRITRLRKKLIEGMGLLMFLGIVVLGNQIQF